MNHIMFTLLPKHDMHCWFHSSALKPIDQDWPHRGEPRSLMQTQKPTKTTLDDTNEIVSSYNSFQNSTAKNLGYSHDMTLDHHGV
jgi:hypothetical protein